MIDVRNSNVPFSLLLQELEPGRPLLLHGGRLHATLSGWNAAIRLDLGGIRTVVGHEVIAVFHSAIAITEDKAVGIGSRAE